MSDTGPINGNAAARTAQGGRAEGPSKSGNQSWFEAMANAWGSALDKQSDEIVELSNRLGGGEDNPSTVNLLQAEAQRMSFLTNASHTAITTIGSALDTMARKQ